MNNNNNKPHKIFLVDDHKLFSDSLRMLIETTGLGIVTAQASNGVEFLKFLDKNDLPDLVLMDINMPSMDGIEATKEALQKWPELKILVVTMHSEYDYYQDMLLAGVKGFVLKTASKSILEEAIGRVLNGESYFSQEFLRKIIVKMDREKTNGAPSLAEELGISPREMEVLKSICSGLSTREIADKLFVSDKTVNAHRNSLLKKTGSRNTTALVLFAIKNKLTSC